LEENLPEAFSRSRTNCFLASLILGTYSVWLIHRGISFESEFHRSYSTSRRLSCGVRIRISSWRLQRN
jgi:hypothetical protein